MKHFIMKRTKHKAPHNEAAHHATKSELFLVHYFAFLYSESFIN